MPLTRNAATAISATLNPATTVLLVCDVQERFRSLIHNMDTLIHTTQYMTRLAALLEIPVFVTQQYTAALGPTVAECFHPPLVDQGSKHIAVFEKKQFSMYTPQVKDHLQQHYPDHTTFIMVGIEAHVCVQQTCLDLLSLSQHHQVHLVCDGISSQQTYDREIALQRMSQAGACLTTAQSVAFALLQTAEHPQFKAVSQLTVEHMKRVNEFNTGTNNW